MLFLLPAEIVLEITNYLPMAAASALAQTCQAYHQLIWRNDYFWQKQLPARFNKPIQLSWYQYYRLVNTTEVYRYRDGKLLPSQNRGYLVTSVRNRNPPLEDSQVIVLPNHSIQLTFKNSDEVITIPNDELGEIQEITLDPPFLYVVTTNHQLVQYLVVTGYTSVGTFQQVSQVAVSYGNRMIRDNHGQIWVSGNNSSGVLGVGSQFAVYGLTKISGLLAHDMAIYQESGAIVDLAGNLYLTGLHDGVKYWRPFHLKIPHRVTKVRLSRDYFLTLDSNGTAWLHQNKKPPRRLLDTVKDFVVSDTDTCLITQHHHLYLLKWSPEIFLEKIPDIRVRGGNQVASTDFGLTIVGAIL